MPCLISFTWEQSTCQVHVESDKTQKSLAHSGTRTHNPEICSAELYRLSYTASMKAVLLKWLWYIHVLPIRMFTLVKVREWWSRTYFVLNMYCFVLHIGIYMYIWQMTKSSTSPVFAFNMQILSRPNTLPVQI